MQLPRLAFLSLPALLIAPLAVAQHGHRNSHSSPTHTITTTTDYGVLATRDTVTDFESVATGTVIGDCFEVDASVGRRRNRASAETSVDSEHSHDGAGVEVCEEGEVRSNDPLIGASSGTSNSAPGSTTPIQGPHSLRVAYPDIPAGTDVIVTIEFDGCATAGASATASVDINGDGVADFTATADGSRIKQLLQTTVSAKGLHIDITTDASALLKADGHESYEACLKVLAEPGTLPTCTFTNFGTPCGADLNGVVAPGHVLSLEITNAPPDACGFIVAGEQATTPSPLPGGNCNLLIDGRRFDCSSFRTDAAGAATIPLRAPREPLTLSFQAVIFTRDPVTHDRVTSASNGTELVCQ